MNLLIVDGEPATRAGLVDLCKDNEALRIVGAATSGSDGIEAFEALRPDLLVLGAELPDMSGFDVLHALPPRCRRRTILLSNRAETAAAAFSAGVLDYLTKPISSEAFSASIFRAQVRFRSRDRRRRRAWRPAAPAPFPGDATYQRPLLLIGQQERRFYPLEPKNIEYIEAARNYVQYRSASGLFTARESIKDLEAVLQPLGFVRIERSLLVNIRAVAYLELIGKGRFAFTLTSGVRLTSGSRYREIILDALPVSMRAHHPEERWSSPEPERIAPAYRTS